MSLNLRHALRQLAKSPGLTAVAILIVALCLGTSSDLPVIVQGDIGHSHLKGTVNAGGPRVKLRSSGGSIHIQKL
jgi:hypothetical protein